jgi:dipeptidyl aminopeptidase/acylaminoacyl peptidase
MALRRAALIVFALAAVGCGASPSEPGGTPETVTRHLVYHRVIGETGVWIADADGTNARQLVRDGIAPEISPDGSSVAYLADCAASHCAEVHLVPSSGGEPRLLARAGAIEGITWSPDSARIVAVRTQLGTATDQFEPDEALLSIDLASGDEVELARGHFWGWSFSPDGKEIVYAADYGPNPGAFAGRLVDLFVVGSEGGDKPRQITESGDGGYPVWGPKSIAFAKLISHRGWGRHEIWQVQPDGTGRRTITGSLPERFLGQGYIGLIPIDWSDDGRALLAGWLNEWGTVAVAVDPETGKAQSLDSGSETVALSEDGLFALVQSGCCSETPLDEQEVLILPYDGGKPTLVVRGAVSPSWNR